MKTLEEIKKKLKEKSVTLNKQYHVRTIGIFGSYARGEQGKKSDLDILIEFEKPVSLLGLVSLENSLSDFLGIKIDLTPSDDIRPELRERILKEVIYI
jgi:predicted nucleotidyltransferase